MEITRERFVELWHEVGIDDMELITNSNLRQTKNFIIYYDWDTEDISFIYKPSLSLFSRPWCFGWYKMFHVGRGLRCSVPEEEELKELLEILKEDLENEKE